MSGSILQRDVNNTFGLVYQYYPNVFSIFDLRNNIKEFVDKTNLHFKDLRILPNNPNGLIGIDSERFDFLDGTIEQDSTIISIKTLGIAKDGFFIDLDVPDSFHEITDIAELKARTRQFFSSVQKHIDEINSFLLRMSNSQQLKKQRTEVLFFRIKIQFQKSIFDLFSPSFKSYLDTLKDKATPVFDGIKNMVYPSLHYDLLPENSENVREFINPTSPKFKPLPASIIKRSAAILVENADDMAKNILSVRIRGVPFDDCWDLIQTLIA